MKQFKQDDIVTGQDLYDYLERYGFFHAFMLDEYDLEFQNHHCQDNPMPSVEEYISDFDDARLLEEFEKELSDHMLPFELVSVPVQGWVGSVLSMKYKIEDEDSFNQH